MNQHEARRIARLPAVAIVQLDIFRIQPVGHYLAIGDGTYAVALFEHAIRLLVEVNTPVPDAACAKRIKTISGDSQRL